MAQDTRLIVSLTSARFFAAFAVVVLHSGSSWVRDQTAAPFMLKNLLLNGYTGVTFFFVLSGFILQVVYRGKFRDMSDARPYLVSRFARVYPVYLLAILMLLPTIAHFNVWQIPQFFLLQSWTTYPPIENWNGPAWTLSVEALFYIIFPFLSIAAMFTPPKGLLAALLIGAFVILVAGTSSVYATSGPLMDWHAAVPSCIMRIPEFFIGVGAGELYLRGYRIPSILPPSLLAFIFIVILSSSTAKIVAGMISVLTPILIVALAQANSGPTTRFLNWRPLVLLGGASYSLYLMHLPVHAAIKYLGGDNRFIMIIQYPAIILVSLVVFLGFEEPMRERIRKAYGIRRSLGAEIAATAHLPKSD
ncbi:MAG: acyltransferase [Sphingomonas bacterium]